ncbi:ATP-binding cassette domain-containing protein [Fluviicola taffensis]|uniref:ABC transporter ATP-binding protein n=1 Tax=Fluviicola taffensis TaxID=191579 RepID=UPI003137B01E
MQQEIVLEVKNLVKNFKGVQAVKSINLNLHKGEVLGLLGPNGSGKTTTLAMLLGILHPTSGSFSWFNNGTQDENRKRIGSLLETPNFYPYLNAYDNLKVVGIIKNVPNLQERINSVLEMVDLKERGKRPFRSYSLGMKQRLAVASALLSNPEVLVLDEPTNGLDPQGIAEMRQLIIDIAKEGKTIILASHILAEVQIICSHIVILREGEMVYNGSMERLLNQEQAFRLSAANMQQLEQALHSIPGISIAERTETDLLVTCNEKIDGSLINKRLAEQGIYLSELHAHQKNLETIFLEKLTK